MKPLALLATLLVAAPAAAATDLGPMNGVWSGTIGTLPVHVCYDAGNFRDEGKYFYARHLVTIPLIRDEKKPGVLAEGWGNEAKAAEWTVSWIEGDRLEGVWRGNGNSLPIRLTRLHITPDEPDERACAARAFIAPIVAATQIVKAPARSHGLAIERWSLAYPDKESIAVRSFQLSGGSPAVSAINRRLREPFDKDEEGWKYCLRQAGAFGASYFESIEPTLVTTRWLMVNASTDSSCGGAHPNTSNEPILFDRTTGQMVDLYDWFAPSAVEREPVQGYGTIDRLGTALLGRIVERLALENADCRDAVRSASSWSLALTANGMAFTPDLPRVVMACGDTAVLPWNELAGYLNPTGKRKVAALQAELAQR